ncbi:MAG TPA: AI-2E family transporter [Gammaproteobacteria bacterium]
MAFSSDTRDDHVPAQSEQNAPVLRAPIDVRSTALAVLAVLAVLFALHWARDVFIPLMIGIMLSYALSPLVERMHKWRIPRALGAGLLLIGLAGGSGYLVYALSDDAGRLVDRLPDTAEKLRKALHRQSAESEAAVEKVQRAAEHLERAADETAAAARAQASGVMRVQVEQPAFDWKDYLWAGTRGAVEFFVQFGIVLFLTFFLLISGDTFRRKLVRITGPTLSKKKITLQVLDDIDRQIQRYLLVQVGTSTLVGLATWLAFLWLGLQHAAVLGSAAGALNIIPYLGPVLATAGGAVVALLQFGTLDMTLLIAGVALLINGLEGYLLTPWLTGRANSMSAVVVFVSVLFWGWLWGVWGLLLGVPIMVMVKAVCDRVEDLKPIGELLGD